MTEKIDHIDRARKAIDAGMRSIEEMHAITANEAVADELGTPEYMLAAVSQLGAFAKAQAEATIALAEQQRAANLITWTTANGSEPSPEIAAAITDMIGVTRRAAE